MSEERGEYKTGRDIAPERIDLEAIMARLASKHYAYLEHAEEDLDALITGLAVAQERIAELERQQASDYQYEHEYKRMLHERDAARREVEGLREVVVRIRERHDGSIGADTRICRCSTCEDIRGVLSGATSPDPRDAEIERLRGQVAAKDAAILEAAEWLESRPDMNEGDATTSSRLRAALSTTGSAEAAVLAKSIVWWQAWTTGSREQWEQAADELVAAVAAMQGKE